jgi:hypothetical protein
MNLIQAIRERSNSPQSNKEQKGLDQHWPVQLQRGSFKTG